MLQQEAIIERTRERHSIALPASLLERLDRRFAETFSAPGPEGS
jgi:hypothetical protein